MTMTFAIHFYPHHWFISLLMIKWGISELYNNGGPRPIIVEPTPEITVSRERGGYLTTPQELAQIRTLADSGEEPFATIVQQLLDLSDPLEAFNYRSVSGAFYVKDGICRLPEYRKAAEYINAADGGHLVYQMMLLYHLTNEEAYARAARIHILDLTDTTSFGGDVYSGSNECILMLGFSIPVWIQAADLLEDVPIWSASDRLRFQNWLAAEVYPKVAWASRVRANNWGSAGSLAASMIGDYLIGREIELVEVAPERRTFSPAQAYAEHNALQLARIKGTLNGDSECDEQGIQPYGGIPDELRRGSTGCDSRWLQDDDRSLTYTTTQIEHLVFHAEYLSRRSDASLFEQAAPDGGTLLDAILFVLDNPTAPEHSLAWTGSHRGTLFVAYQYYGCSLLLEEALRLETYKGGNTLPYAQLTHRFVPEQASSECEAKGS